MEDQNVTNVTGTRGKKRKKLKKVHEKTSEQKRKSKQDSSALFPNAQVSTFFFY